MHAHVRGDVYLQNACYAIYIYILNLIDGIAYFMAY